MSASSSVETAAGSITVVTHVIHGPQGAALQHPPDKKQLSQVRLVAFGTVQIMIGLIIFLFGTVLFHRAPTTQGHTGVFVWGALCFITAGSLTVTAGRSLNHCLVNGALGFSIATVVTSAAATTFYILDAINQGHMDWPLICILGVFSFLGFIISICVTVFSCRAYHHFTDQPNILVKLCHETAVEMPEILPPYETPVTSPALPTPPPPSTAPPPPPSESNYETLKPMDYTTVVSNF
ncbi:membrane-spanning 4-domains subfamily A member 15-like isoform X2 [Mastacembelus armatus]|uniref:membrane-spanning 4-domains subfamily A member 15-like isoform X2 n=1 Tax=Mastacembelus armatus TaxID=205130 RepID=UPI000E45B19B|nr:membrane-spanning 4-domains subfamily A member 15-like isoform X2 [Mastacembelus armatus]